MSTDAGDSARLTDHWWPRPGWHPGRVMTTWHLTFEGAPALAAHAATYQRALAPLPGLHPVPARWLHLSVQEVGWADELDDERQRALTAAVTAALAPLPPLDLAFGAPVVAPEGIVLPATPAGPVEDVWRTIRAALGLPAADGFFPHVTLAYAGEEHDAAPHRAALDRVAAPPVAVRVDAVSLIAQLRVLAPEWVYRWTPVATAPLTGR
jgi:2'-5' RNA ligase